MLALPGWARRYYQSWSVQSYSELYRWQRVLARTESSLPLSSCGLPLLLSFSLIQAVLGQVFSLEVSTHLCHPLHTDFFWAVRGNYLRDSRFWTTQLSSVYLDHLYATMTLMAATRRHQGLPNHCPLHLRHRSNFVPFCWEGHRPQAIWAEILATSVLILFSDPQGGLRTRTLKLDLIHTT